MGPEIWLWAVAGLLLMGRISLTVCVLYVFALECCGQTVGNISQVPVVWFCTFLQQFEWRWKASHRHFILAHCLSYIQREKHLRITQCGFDISITATFYVECPFTIFILKLVSALPSPRIGFLVIVRLSFRATAKKQKMHVLAYQKENFPCCVWLAPHDYRLARRNDFHNGGFAESARI